MSPSELIVNLDDPDNSELIFKPTELTVELVLRDKLLIFKPPEEELSIVTFFPKEIFKSGGTVAWEAMEANEGVDWGNGGIFILYAYILKYTKKLTVIIYFNKKLLYTLISSMLTNFGKDRYNIVFIDAKLILTIIY